MLFNTTGHPCNQPISGIGSCDFPRLGCTHSTPRRPLMHSPTDAMETTLQIARLQSTLSMPHRPLTPHPGWHESTHTHTNNRPQGHRHTLNATQATHKQIPHATACKAMLYTHSTTHATHPTSSMSWRPPTEPDSIQRCRPEKLGSDKMRQSAGQNIMQHTLNS
jgi:hypothetical protein